MVSKQGIEGVFTSAPFVSHIGIEFVGIGTGWCEASLAVQPWHLQQTGVVHAGAVATLADHCAGAAASVGLDPGAYVVTAEYKINLLSGARGERLFCRATVLKAGRMLRTVESEVFAEDSGNRSLVAKLNATMAVVRPADSGQAGT